VGSGQEEGGGKANFAFRKNRKDERPKYYRKVRYPRRRRIVTKTERGSGKRARWTFCTEEKSRKSAKKNKDHHEKRAGYDKEFGLLLQKNVKLGGEGFERKKVQNLLTSRAKSPGVGAAKHKK